MGISLIFLWEVLEVFTDSSRQQLLFSSLLLFASTLPESLIVPRVAVTLEPGALLLATRRPAFSTSCCMVRSTTGSPRLSLESGIVTLPDAAVICTPVVWLNSRGVRSSIGDCPRGTFPVGNDLFTAVANPSRSDRSLYSCLKRFYLLSVFLVSVLKQSPTHFSFFFSSEQGLSHPLQFVFRLVQVFHCFIRLDFFFYSSPFW